MKRDDISPKPGDILFVDKYFFEHIGVYLGEGLVYHNKPSKGEHISDLEEFLNGNQIKRIAKLTPEKREEVLNNVREELENKRPYNIFENNCEHTVYRVIQRNPRSPQLKKWVGIAVENMAWYLSDRRR